MITDRERESWEEKYQGLAGYARKGGIWGSSSFTRVREEIEGPEAYARTDEISGAHSLREEFQGPKGYSRLTEIQGLPAHTQTVKYQGVKSLRA